MDDPSLPVGTPIETPTTDLHPIMGVAPSDGGLGAALGDVLHRGLPGNLPDEPLRRLELFIESSIKTGIQWVTFEANAEPLWAALRLSVGTFMQNLFLKGSFAGTTPQQAYFVKCDADNNPQASIDEGVVNITVGFAPLYPAEFVVIQIQQMAGQGSNS